MHKSINDKLKTSLKSKKDKYEKSMGSYKCKLCSYQTEYAYCLRRHEEYEHETHKLRGGYECAVCEETFIYDGSRTTHMKMCHPHVDLLRCHVCSKYFARMPHVKHHVKTFHLRKRSVLECPNCDFKAHGTTAGTKLRLHVEKQHSLECETCSKTFSNVWFLRRHKVDSHPEECYNCKHCSKVFPRADNLSYHVNTSHRNVHS